MLISKWRKNVSAKTVAPKVSEITPTRGKMFVFLKGGEIIEIQSFISALSCLIFSVLAVILGAAP